MTVISGLTYGPYHKLYLVDLFKNTLAESLIGVDRFKVIFDTPTTPDAIELINELGLVFGTFPKERVREYLDSLYNITFPDENFRQIYVQSQINHYPTSLFCRMGYHMRLERTKRLSLTNARIGKQGGSRNKSKRVNRNKRRSYRY